MDVCPRLSVMCYPVAVDALRQADPPSKRQADQTFQKVILNRNRSKELTRATELELGEVNVLCLMLLKNKRLCSLPFFRDNRTTW
jgi:hypothetical protein